MNAADTAPGSSHPTAAASGGQQGLWPLSVREFMKLPVSGLRLTGTRIRFTRVPPAGQAAYGARKDR